MIIGLPSANRVIEIAAPIPEQIVIAARDFTTGLTIRSATPADTIGALRGDSTVNRLILDDLHIQMGGWPKNHLACITTTSGDFIEWTIRGGSWRHGYGPTLANLPYQLNSTDQPEIERVDHVVTATATAVRYEIDSRIQTSLLHVREQL
jgi:hypothetical protein